MQPMRAPPPQAGQGEQELKSANGFGAAHLVVVGISCGLSAPWVGAQLHWALAAERSGRCSTVLVGFNPPQHAPAHCAPGWPAAVKPSRRADTVDMVDMATTPFVSRACRRTATACGCRPHGWSFRDVAVQMKRLATGQALSSAAEPAPSVVVTPCLGPEALQVRPAPLAAALLALILIRGDVGQACFRGMDDRPDPIIGPRLSSSACCSRLRLRSQGSSRLKGGSATLMLLHSAFSSAMVYSAAARNSRTASSRAEQQRRSA